MTTKCRICSNKRRRGSSECNDIHFNEACYVRNCTQLALDPGGMCPRHDWEYVHGRSKEGEKFIHQFETKEEWETAHKEVEWPKNR